MDVTEVLSTFLSSVLLLLQAEASSAMPVKSRSDFFIMILVGIIYPTIALPKANTAEHLVYSGELLI
jgi:hypothetical protein